MLPTQRTLKWLRDQGYIAEVVERWNQFSRTRKDLYGFIDVVAMKPGQLGLLAVQACSGSNMAAREAKIRSVENHKHWLEAGNKIAVIGWRQVVSRKKDGTKAKRKAWEPRVVEIVS